MLNVGRADGKGAQIHTIGKTVERISSIKVVSQDDPKDFLEF